MSKNKIRITSSVGHVQRVLNLNPTYSQQDEDSWDDFLAGFSSSFLLHDPFLSFVVDTVNLKF